MNFLDDKLSNKEAFHEKNIKEISSVLKRLENYEEPYLEDDYYDLLGDRVVDYYKHFGSQPHIKNSELYR